MHPPASHENEDGPSHGLTLIEVVIAVVLLAITTWFTLATLSQNRAQQERIKEDTAIHQFEEDIRLAVAKRITTLLAANCQSTPFEKGMTIDLASGVELKLFSSDASLPDNKLSPTARAARDRCRTSQTFAQIADMGAREAIYFCLTIAPTSSSTGGLGSLTAMQPVFAEFLYTPWQLVTGKKLTCEERRGNVRGMDIFHYTFYWKGRDGAAGSATRHYSNIYVSAGG